MRCIILSLKRISKHIIFFLTRLSLNFSPNESSEDLEDYHNCNTKIRKLYDRSLFWHGTGRYRYIHDYDSSQSNGQIDDALEGILQNGGILPLVKDPWMKSNGKFLVTISLAKIRFYAAVYAFMNLFEGEDIYKYGSRLLWLFVIDVINFIEKPLDVLKHLLIFTFKIGNKKLRKYQSKSRSYTKLKNLRTFFLQLFYMATMRSDIEGNYPIIVAVKMQNLSFVEINSGFNYYEARVDEAISLKDISHLEVPRKNLEETRALLKQHSANIPVIAIEDAELFAKYERSIKELLTPA
jgi:hypothetical protein